MFALSRSLSVRYWQRHRLRALLVLLSLALGGATWAATALLHHTLDRTSRQAATPLAGAASFYVSNGDAGVLSELATPLRRIPGVRTVSPLVLQRVVLPDLHQRSVTLLGLDVVAGEQGTLGEQIHIEERPPTAALQDFFLARKPVLVGRALERALPADSGHLTVLAAGRPQRLMRVGVISGTGPAAALSGEVLVLSCDDAAALFGWRDRVSRLDLFLEPEANPATVRAQVEEALHGQASVWTPESHDGRVQEMLQGLQIGLTLCGLGALVVGGFLVYNTFAVAVAERRHEIGMLRSLGATRGQILGLFLLEALLLGLVGALLGLPAGIGLAQMGLGPATTILGDIFVPLPNQGLALSLGPLLGAVLACLATALLASVRPAWSAARETPAAALRRLPPERVQGRHRLGVILAAGCALGGSVLVWLRAALPERVGSAGGLILLVVAMLLAIPYLAAGLARGLHALIGRRLDVSTRLALDNLLLSSGRTGLVIAALVAGVALFVQTAGLIVSNEAAIRTWVDGSIAGDLFITSGGPLSASGRTLAMGQDVIDQLQALVPEMQVVPMRFRYLDWQVHGKPTRVLVLALDAVAYHSANQQRQPPLAHLDLYRQLAEQPGTALVSENFAALHHIHPGDTLALPGLEGPVSLRVLGAVEDYSCNRGTVIVDREQNRRQLDCGLIDVLDVYLPPSTDIEATRALLLASPASLQRGLAVLTRRELRGHILGMVQRLYGLAYGQEILVAIVAVLGVISALLISVLQRQRELGLLRAVGATRAQVLRSVLAEGVFLGGIGTLLGVLAGGFLEWYTVRVLLFEESGFVCPLRVPWLTVAGVVLVTLASALAAGLGPAVRAAHLSIPRTIAHE